MILSTYEIEPGLVAHLDEMRLYGVDGIVVRKADPSQPVSPKLRPYLCVGRDAARSSWTPLSTAINPHRLYLKDEWRSGGSRRWRGRGEIQLLLDGAFVVHGPHDLIVAASFRELSEPTTRWRLSPDGVEAVLAEMRRQYHRSELMPSTAPTKLAALAAAVRKIGGGS